MTANLFLQCVGCGFIGILFHILLKIKALKKRSKAANINFSYVEFISEESITIAISAVAVVIFIIVLPELINYRSWIQDWVRFLFVFVGFTGSSILQSFFSKTEKNLLDVIDKKTNIADNKTD